MTTQLAIYNTAAASLAELEKQYKDVPVDLSTKEGLELCKETAKKFQKLRTGVERTRKDANADAQAHIKKVNGEAKDIQDRIAPLEDKFAKPLNERKERIKSGIAEIDNVVEVCRGRDSAFIGEKIQWLESVDVKDFFEFQKDAKASLYTANEKLTELFTETLQREEEDRKQKERARIERIDSVINGLKGKAFDCMGKDKNTVQSVIDEVSAVIIDDSFGEKKQEAEQTKSMVIQQLEMMLSNAPEPQVEEAPSFVLDESDPDAGMFTDCVADSDVVKLTPREDTVNALLDVLGGDIEAVDAVMSAIESGKVPYIKAMY